MNNNISEHIENKQYPKVLIYGKSFNPNTGGGITISNLFRNWPKNKLGIANNRIVKADRDVCKNWYLLDSLSTDKNNNNKENNILKASECRFIRFVKKIIRPFYSLPNNYLILKGKRSKIKIDKDFIKWVKDFNPEIIYCMAHRLHHIPFLIELKKKTKIPLALHIVDDWINVNYFGFFNFIGKKVLNSEFKKLLKTSKVLMGISLDMQMSYKKRYDQIFLPFHNPVNLLIWEKIKHKSYEIKNDFQILFAGTIEAYNIDEIEKMCEVVDGIKNNIVFNIFGSVRKIEYLQRLKKYKKCRINGLIDHDKIIKLFVSHDLLFLPLSFKRKLRNAIALSMPTKVAEYMISGTPILVFAPEELALTRYAIEDQWALVLTNPDIISLKNKLYKIINDEETRSRIGIRANKIAKQNHDSVKIQKRFIKLLKNGGNI